MSEVTTDNRALDRQIAERLGYRQNGDLWEYDTPHGFPAIVEDLPHYSTDLNAAWTLTEPYAFNLVPLYTGDGKVGCIAVLSDTDGRTWKGEAETPALAICRAWLAITGHKHITP